MSDGAARIIRVEGRIVPLPGNDIDTDRIIPGRFLKVITFAGLEQHVFEDDIASRAARGEAHPFATDGYRGASILVVNRNFGCGSSREHAPQALLRWGIKAIVGESYSEIFFGNSLAIGLPCVTADPATLDWMQAVGRPDAADVAVLDLVDMTVTVGDRSAPIALPRAAQEALITGAWDATGSLLEHYEDVEATAARLPYVSGW